MMNLFQSKDFNWSLFIGHLVIEKLLKALYVKNIDQNIPKIHDLLRLAELTKIDLTDEKSELLDFVTTFNINSRYPDYKQEFYKKCTQDFTKNSLEKIEGLRKWLLNQI